jgi:hypothetical protein
VQAAFKLHSIPFGNLIGFCADNASVCMGVMSSLKTRLLAMQPFLFVLGCTCHTLALIASWASKMLPAWLEQVGLLAACCCLRALDPAGFLG